jgi:hypothetical protein
MTYGRVKGDVAVWRIFVGRRVVVLAWRAIAAREQPA